MKQFQQTGGEGRGRKRNGGRSWRNWKDSASGSSKGLFKIQGKVPALTK